MEFVYPILIFVVMGIVFGVLLVVISKVFAVETDERAVKITEALPGANCGACGYAGCADYADAIVNKGAPMNACLPGGANAAAAIGGIMGVSVSASERMIRCCTATATATPPTGSSPLTACSPVRQQSGFTAAQASVPMDVLDWGIAFPSVKTMSSPSRTALPHSARKVRLLQ